MSTKCQYRPLISTGVKYCGLNVPLRAMIEYRGHEAHANHHVQGVETGHEEVEAKHDLGLRRVELVGLRYSPNARR